MNSRAWRWALALTAAGVATACSDRDITQPTKAVGDIRPTYSISSQPGDVVGILKRTEDVPSDLTATKIIGPAGGHIQLNRAGLRIEFAPGAVAVPTAISVTALPGRNVAYTFKPHGLVFAAPVSIRQHLRHTVAWKQPELSQRLEGSYFEQLIVDQTHSYAQSQERRVARLRDAGRVIEFTIEHFSGYMLSTGKAPVEVELEIELRER